MSKGHYKYLFDCRSCAMTEERRCNTVYCVPIADGNDPLTVDGENRTVSCTKYKPKGAAQDEH